MKANAGKIAQSVKITTGGKVLRVTPVKSRMRCVRKADQPAVFISTLDINLDEILNQKWDRIRKGNAELASRIEIVRNRRQTYIQN